MDGSHCCAAGIDRCLPDFTPDRTRLGTYIAFAPSLTPRQKLARISCSTFAAAPSTTGYYRATTRMDAYRCFALPVGGDTAAITLPVCYVLLAGAGRFATPRQPRWAARAATTYRP